MKFLELFWKHKFSWHMWLRLVISPIMLSLLLVSFVCDKAFSILNDKLPKVDL